jgi:hypothetical protein
MYISEIRITDMYISQIRIIDMHISEIQKFMISTIDLMISIVEFLISKI